MWPSEKEQIHTSVQAGGIAKALIRFSRSDSESFDPSARVYANPFPAFFRRMPGRVSDPYLRPADSAASLGSTICALSAKSTSLRGALGQRLDINIRHQILLRRCASNEKLVQPARTPTERP